MAFRERSREGQSPFRLDAMTLPIPGHLSTDVTTHLRGSGWLGRGGGGDSPLFSFFNSFAYSLK